MIGFSVNIKAMGSGDKYKFYELENIHLSHLMNDITSKFGVDCRIADDNSLSLLIGTTIKTGRDVRMRANIPDIPLMRGELEMDNAVSISKALKSKFPDHEIKLIFYNYLGNDYQC